MLQCIFRGILRTILATFFVLSAPATLHAAIEPPSSPIGKPSECSWNTPNDLSWIEARGTSVTSVCRARYSHRNQEALQIESGWENTELWSIAEQKLISSTGDGGRIYLLRLVYAGEWTQAGFTPATPGSFVTGTAWAERNAAGKTLRMNVQLGNDVQFTVRAFRYATR